MWIQLEQQAPSSPLQRCAPTLFSLRNLRQRVMFVWRCKMTEECALQACCLKTFTVSSKVQYGHPPYRLQCM